MDAVSTSDFLRWTASVGIGIDPRYPKSGCLSLLPPGDHARFWVVPGEPIAWPHFADSILSGFDGWSGLLLWPRSGTWPATGEPASLNDRVRGTVLRGAGVPAGWNGALRFRDREADAVVAILFAYLAFGFCTADDLFLIPDHGRQLVQTDHHGVIHVQCGSEPRILEFVAHMAAHGYELPKELPDWTFKQPAWMDTGPA
jgi:hypothetical protein